MMGQGKVQIQTYPTDQIMTSKSDAVHVTTELIFLSRFCHYRNLCE